jgi:hypothetical protein
LSFRALFQIGSSSLLQRFCRLLSMSSLCFVSSRPHFELAPRPSHITYRAHLHSLHATSTFSLSDCFSSRGTLPWLTYINRRSSNIRPFFFPIDHGARTHFLLLLLLPSPTNSMFSELPIHDRGGSPLSVPRDSCVRGKFHFLVLIVSSPANLLLAPWQL